MWLSRLRYRFSKSFLAMVRVSVGYHVYRKAATVRAGTAVICTAGLFGVGRVSRDYFDGRTKAIVRVAVSLLDSNTGTVMAISSDCDIWGLSKTGVVIEILSLRALFPKI